MSLEPHGELVPVGGGDAIPLVREHLVVGRRDSCDICLRFPNISGLHCELTFRDGYWLIRDMGSTNGIKVNGQRLQQKVLRPGDEVTIAKRKFTINYNLGVGQHALEEIEEDLSQSLLEKAGLERPKPSRDVMFRRQSLDPGNYLLEDDEDN
jgi:adenylate cyclase